MAPVPTKHFALATMATAVLAFLLVVPSVLHIAAPLSVIGNAAGTGYGHFVPHPTPPTPTPQVPTPATPTPSTPAGGGQGNGNGNGGNGASAGTPPTPTTPSVAPPTPTPSNGPGNAGGNGNGNGNAGTPPTNNPTPTTPSSPTPATPTPSTPTPSGGATQSTSDAQPLSSGQTATFTIPSSTPLEPASVFSDAAALNLVQDHTHLTAAVQDTAQFTSLVSTESALNTVLSDAGSAQAFADQVTSSPAALATLAQHPAAAAAFLNSAQVQAKLQADPVLQNQVISALESQQHVNAVDLTAGTSGSNVQVNVKEFLPTDATQTAITPGEGSSLAHITLQVSTPGTGGATSFNVVKVLEISAAGLPAGGVQKATVHFTVTQAELTAMGISSGQVQLLHQVNGQWVPLPTTLVSGPANGQFEFSADTPSFSYFAIAAAQPVQSTSGTFAGLGIALLILGVLAVIAIAVVVVMKKKQQ